MAISQRVRDLIASAWPDYFPCLVATIGPDGPQISPKSSVRVFDDTHLAYWERSKRSALRNLGHDDRVCIYYANFADMKEGKAPRPILFRFYGRARLVEKESEPDLYRRIFDNMSEFEKTHAGADTAIGVLIAIDRAENLMGAPIE
jgi:uncharacterized protein